jgi:hypothetical protein
MTTQSSTTQPSPSSAQSLPRRVRRRRSEDLLSNLALLILVLLVIAYATVMAASGP